MTVDADLIRPPYQSTWPYIPNEAEIERLLADLREVEDGGDLTRSVDHIRFSVSAGDFSSYVIGHRETFPWLQLPRSADLWQSPQERIEAWLTQLNETERLTWQKYENARMRAHWPSP